MYIIIGSGNAALNLASKLENRIIADSDRRRIEKLRESGYNAIYVDFDEKEWYRTLPVSESTVILASDDETNLRIAEILKSKAKQLIAISNSDTACSEYERLGISKVCRSGFAARVLSEVVETNRRYIEVEVDSGFDGKTLRDVDVGESCTVVSVLRSGKLLRPHPELELSRGDVIGILCGREVKYTKNPLEEVLVIISNPEDVDTLLKEAEFIKNKFGSQLLYLYKYSGNIACSIRGVADCEIMDDEEILTSISSLPEKIDLIISSKKNPKIVEFAEKVPVLIAKGNVYSKVLAIVNTSSPDDILTFATSFGNFIGEAKVLMLSPSQISHSAKLTEAKLKVELSEGNPVIDAVKEAKSYYDLIILSRKNDVGNIDRHLLNKIIFDTKASVLVVP